MKKVALVLHGWPCHDITQHFLVKYLKKAGYEVLSPDLFLLDSRFTLKEIDKYLTKKLRGRSLALIVGMSMGGMILPYIARNHSKAKLVFIATGPRLKTDSKLLNILLRSLRLRYMANMARIVIGLPRRALQALYFLVNPLNMITSKKERVNEMMTNIISIKQISVSKESEILNFVLSTDSSSVLALLPNKSIIFSGSNDHLMPLNLGEELHRLLVDSELITNSGEHFNVLTTKELSIIENFLDFSYK